MTGKWLSERMSKVKEAFEKALGKTVAQDFVVQSEGKNSNLKYWLALKEEGGDRFVPR